MDLLDDSSSCASSSLDEEKEEEEETTISHPKHHPPPEPQPIRIARKARKILSLAAVLPQHILDELTQRQDENSSDDDDDDRKVSSPIMKRRSITTTTTTSRSNDGRMSHFLSDLKAVRPTTGDSSFEFHKRESSSSRGVTTTQPLGAALLQTTTFLQKAGTAGVRNIHETEEYATNDSSSFIQKKKDNHAPTEPTEQISVEHSSQPPNHPIIKRLSLVRPVILESAPRIIIPSHQDDSVACTTAAHSSSARMLSSNHFPVEHTDEPSTGMHTNDDDNGDQHYINHTNKRSRREMEKALRKGNFQSLDASQNHVTHYLEQARPDSFVPDPETYAVPQHGIKVVPTAMYDPKAGTSTNLAAGKGRGKNQIHHLMASAANLELQRARGMASSGSSSHRANAKQKYGW